MFDFRPWPRNHMGISEVNQEDRFHMISPTEMGTECSSAINRYEDVHNPPTSTNNEWMIQYQWDYVGE